MSMFIPYKYLYNKDISNEENNSYRKPYKKYLLINKEFKIKYELCY